MRSDIFIGVPVHQGTDVVAETLRSIKAQTYEGYRVLISVDGQHEPALEICEEYAATDSRFEVVVHKNHMGWAANLNWLVRSCDLPFFIYWPQDDLASTGYLEELRNTLVSQPAASVAYTDVQWFGARFNREGTPTIQGEPLSRVMQSIEAIRYEPLRGLMRASMLPDDDNPIPITEDLSSQEEFVFLTRMAAEGDLVRCADAMYFKRLHAGNVSTQWKSLPDWRRRRSWIDMGWGMYQVAKEVAHPDRRPLVLANLLDRLAIDRLGRGFFHNVPQTPQEIRRFVHDFVSRTRVGADVSGAVERDSDALGRPIHPEITAALLAYKNLNAEFQRMKRRLAEEGSLAIGASEGRAGPVLGFGWSHEEPWGVWTDGGEASIRVPAPAGSSWRATLEGRVYAPNGPVRIGIGVGENEMTYLEVNRVESLTETVMADARDGDTIRLYLPDARSPTTTAHAVDQRALGIGLTRLDIRLL